MAKVLGELDAALPGRVQQLEQRVFLAVLRAGRIPGRRADAAVGSPISASLSRFSPWRSPSAGPHPRMQVFGERFRQPVGQRFDHDARVVVVGVLGQNRLDADPGGHRERPR